MRIYVAASVEDLRRLAAGEQITSPAFVAATGDEEDELAALEAAAEEGTVAIAADADDPDGPIGLDDVASFHLDLDGTGDLAWFARQEIDTVLQSLTGG